MIDDESLWQEFLAESEEHLDRLEHLLGAGSADRPAIDALFRACHSLKGMSDALGATGMKALAHRCEDLLGLARQGRLAVEGATADLLLEAVDALRRLRARLAEARQDGAAPAELLRRLAALAEAPADPAPTGPPAMPVARGDDPLLASLASLLREAAPRLAALARARDAEGMAAAASLAEAAAGLDLHRLAAVLAALPAAAASPAALVLLGTLRRQALLLEERSAEPAGAAGIAEALADPALLAPALAALAVRLEELVAGEEGVSVAPQAREAAEMATALDLPGAERLLRLVEDLTDRGADPDAAAILAAEGPALVERLRQAAEGGAAAIRALLPPEEAAASTAENPGVPPEFLAVLGSGGRRRAAALLAGGLALFRVRMALGRPAEEEAAAEYWLRGAGEVLTSRTLLEAAPPQLDILLASRTPLDRLRAALAVADPEGRVVLGLEPAEVGPANAAGTAPVTLRVRQDTVDGIIALGAEVRAAAMALAEALGEGGGQQAMQALAFLERRLTGAAARELSTALDRLRALQAQLERSEGRLSLAMRQLDEAVMELRVVPIGTLMQRLPRVVRTVAEASGKQVELVLEGQEVTLDRSLVEMLADPLLHLARNAVDHGVEPPAVRIAAGKPAKAVLRVRAERRSGQVRLTISDDGRGIDRAAVLRTALARGLISAAEAEALPPERVQALLFRPGFSTRQEVTETSGRGVGLDVVQDAVRRAGGVLDMASEPGRGASFTLTMPLTAAVQPVLLVEVGGHPYALPAGRVETVLEATARTAAGCEVVSLSRLLGLDRGQAAGPVVVMHSRGGLLGLAVEKVQRRTDLLLRPLHPALAAMPGIGGVGVLGNGDPVVVLEPDGMVSR